MTEEKNKQLKDDIENAIKKITDFMNFECQVQTREEIDDRANKTMLISVYAPDNSRLLIGRNGQNIRAFEGVLRAMFLKNEGSDIRNISIDINDYKKVRADYLIDVARRAVARVRSAQKSESLAPMSSYERRIVHMELASYPDIETESIGEEPQRRIVIKPLS